MIAIAGPVPVRRQMTLRAKAVIAFVAFAVYFGVAGTLLSWHRTKLANAVEDFDAVHQVESSLTRVNTFTAHTLIQINENYLIREPRQVVEPMTLDVDSITAGLRGLREWYPRADSLIPRLQEVVADMRRQPTRAHVEEVRANLHEVVRDLDQVSREVRARRDALWAGYRSNYDRVTLITVTTLLVGVLVFGAVVLVFFRRLAWDLRDLATRAVDIVRGYRGEPLPVSRTDEVGALMDSVNRMQQILRAREQQIEVARQQRFHQEKMVAIGSLAAAVAHEINNPIAAIEGAMQSGESTGDRDRILEHTRRIVSITNQLSAMAAAPSTEPEWVDLNALVRTATTFVSFDPRTRSVRMDLDLDPSIPAVWAVADHVSQTLMNLLLNAADAVQDVKTRERRIVVATAAEAESVRLTVTDNGTGMLPEVLSRAFEEGFTTKPMGSGVGLFMCRHLVEKGGGNITASSSAGTGTTVTVRLARSGEARS